MSTMTADMWCMQVIAELRPIFKEKNWPLPERIRAKQIHHHNSKWTKVIPSVDQSDGFAIVRYPGSFDHAERVIPAILDGLYGLALAERRKKGPVIPFDFGSTVFLRDHIGLTNVRNELTRFGIAIVRRTVAKIGAFPEGSSHPKPSKRYQRTTFYVACTACGQVWFRQNRTQYELAIAFGGFRCLMVDCGGTLRAIDAGDDEADLGGGVIILGQS